MSDVPYMTVLPYEYFKPDLRGIKIPKRGCWWTVGEESNIFETDSYCSNTYELYDNFSFKEINKMEGKAVVARAKEEKRRKAMREGRG